MLYWNELLFDDMLICDRSLMKEKRKSLEKSPLRKANKWNQVSFNPQMNKYWLETHGLGLHIVVPRSRPCSNTQCCCDIFPYWRKWPGNLQNWKWWLQTRNMGWLMQASCWCELYVRGSFLLRFIWLSKFIKISAKIGNKKRDLIELDGIRKLGMKYAHKAFRKCYTTKLKSLFSRKGVFLQMLRMTLYMVISVHESPGTY